MFSLTRLSVGLLGALMVASFVFHQGWSWGRQSQQTAILKKENQILILHKTIEDMIAEANEKQNEFNNVLRSAREQSGPTEKNNEIHIPKIPSDIPVRQPTVISRVPDKYKGSTHCRDC